MPIIFKLQNDNFNNISKPVLEFKLQSIAFGF
jgi:hypothetical protein